MKLTVKKLPQYGAPYRHPAFEIFAPDGYSFSGGEHSLIAWDKAERDQALQEEIEPCPADCECRDE